MRILAIDTALGACSAVLFDTDTNQPLAIQSVDMNRGHAEALIPLVERVMKAADVKFDAIDRIATTIGPGSFTGLRVGIAAARGFALACQKPVVGVTTLAALSAPYATEKETVPVVSAIDARHDNVYLHMVGAGGRMLVAPRIASLHEAIRAVALGLVRIVGSGATMLASQWPLQEVPAPLLVDPRPAPDVTWVARLGAAADPERAMPRPLYLRPPDARPQDAHRLPRQ
jgi:tRNA threonylcarbamoyladenosine biosynthesis protein TsaB